MKLTELLTAAEKDEPLSPLNIYRKMLGKAKLLSNDTLLPIHI